MLVFILICLWPNKCRIAMLCFPSVKMDFWFFFSSSEGLEQSSICTQEIARDKICISFHQSPPRLSLSLSHTTLDDKKQRMRERRNGSYVGDSVDLNLLNLLTGGMASVRATTAHSHINTTTNSNIVKRCCDSPLFIPMHRLVLPRHPRVCK